MHIIEGFLSLGHATGWTMASLPFVVLGLASITRRLVYRPVPRRPSRDKTARAFPRLAARPPSVTGACPHPAATGVGSRLAALRAAFGAGFIGDFLGVAFRRERLRGGRQRKRSS